MNSTFKVGYNSQTGKAVCKVIFEEIKQIIEEKSSNPGVSPDTFVFHEDEDERDKMVREFLHHPLYSEPYDFYQKGCRIKIPNGKTLVTIEPIDERDLFYRFRHAVLNRFVPYDTLVALNQENKAIESGDKKSTPGGLPIRKYYDGEDLANKINEFFDWLDNTEYATQAQRWPNISQF